MTLNTTVPVGRTEGISGVKQKRQTSGLQKRENGEDGGKSMRLIDADLLEPDADYDDGEYWAYSVGQIHNAPTIEERKMGEWIYKNDLKQFFYDQCGEPSLTDDDVYIYDMVFPNFCPNCGCKMEGKQP